MAIQFQEIIVLPSHIKISVSSMSCADNATTSENLTPSGPAFSVVRQARGGGGVRGPDAKSQC